MQRNKQTDGTGVAAAEGRGGISTVYKDKGRDLASGFCFFVWTDGRI